MSIYLVNADALRFSAKQLEAVSRLPGCPDFGGILEGVAWVRDNDGDIIILAVEHRRDCFFRLLPRRHLPYHMDVFYRAADYLTTCGVVQRSKTPPVKVGWGVTAGLCVGGEWLMRADTDYVNQKALNVDQGKLNIRYKEGDEK